MALDEVLLEVQGLRLRARDDHLHVSDPLDELRRPQAAVPALEVAADARAQRFRLADVEDVAVRVAKEIDARASGESPKLSFKVFSHSRASVSPCVFHS
jgi:hypothetical protein